MRAKYLFVFAQVHEEFRIPELLSVSEMHGIEITFPGPLAELDVSKPFMVLELANEEDARTLARRCILIKSVCELYARGKTYADVHAETRSSASLYSRFVENTPFKFSVTGYNHTIPQWRQREVVESFSYMGLLGKIDMKNPGQIFVCHEEYIDKHGTTRSRQEGDGDCREIFFGRLIEEGSARRLVKTFDVKKRSYYGNTSMEAEMSLLMANQALAAPGKVVYDPFIGTGSMAYTTAYFGAYVYGSDIDGRQMRGKEKISGIVRAARQYNVADHIMDLCTFDVTRNPWRCGEIFDAIITDPPYGVRAGAKRLGRKKKTNSAHTTDTECPTYSRPEDQQLYIPPTKPYELSALATDLVQLARHLLKPGGRLVFFLPTVTDEYEEVDIQTMLCEGMEVIANSLQDFGSWGRRLITVRKTSSTQYPPPTFEPKHDQAETDDTAHVPAHKDFRQKYFQGFKRDGE